MNTGGAVVVGGINGTDCEFDLPPELDTLECLNALMRFDKVDWEQNCSKKNLDYIKYSSLLQTF